MRRRINKSYLNLSMEAEEIIVEEPTGTPAPVVVPETVAGSPEETPAPTVVVTTATAVVPSASPATVDGLDVPNSDVPSSDTPAVDTPMTEPAAEPVATEPAAEPTVIEPPAPDAGAATEPPAAAEEPFVEPTTEPATPGVDTPATTAAEPTAEPEVPAAGTDPTAAAPTETTPVEEPTAPTEVTPDPTAAEPVVDTPAAMPETTTPTNTEPTVDATLDATTPQAASTETAVAGAAEAAAASLAGADLPPDTKVVVVVVEPTISTDDQDELFDMGEDVEGEVEEAEVIAQEAEEVCAEIVIADSAANDLTKLVQVAQDASENGGLSDDGARMLTVAVEGIYERLDLAGHNGIPALESFQGTYSRVGATTIAIEDIQDKLKAIGSSIVEGMKKIWEFLKKFFASVFTATGRLEARAKKVLELSKGFKGNGAATLEDAAVFKRVVVGTAVPRDLAAGMSMLNDFVADATSSVHADPIVKLSDSVKNLFDKGRSNQEAFTQYMDTALNDSFNTMKIALNLKSLSAGNSGRAVEFGAPESSEGTTLKASATFPGNVIIWAHVPDNEEHISGLAIGTVQAENTSAGKTLPNLSGDEIAKIAQQAIRFTSMKNQFEVVYKDVEKAFMVVGNIGTMMGTIQSMDKMEKSGEIRKGIQKIFRVMSALSNGVHRHAIAQGLRANNAALDYAQLALSSATKTGTAPAQLAAKPAAA